MKISEISEEFDGEEYDGIEGSIMEQEMIGEEKSQGDLSSAAGSFVSARFSLSSSSSSSLSSTPSSSCLVSPTLTPLNRRVIGRDVEVRVSFGWLPFTDEEWYRHPPQANTWGGMAEQGASLADLVAPHQAGQTRATQFQRELLIIPPSHPNMRKIVMRIFTLDASSQDTFTWNPLRLLVPRRRQGWVFNESNAAKALRLAHKVDRGVSSATLQRHAGNIVITGEHLDPVKFSKMFRRKSGLADVVSFEEIKKEVVLFMGNQH